MTKKRRRLGNGTVPGGTSLLIGEEVDGWSISNYRIGPSGKRTGNEVTDKEGKPEEISLKICKLWQTLEAFEISRPIIRDPKVSKRGRPDMMHNTN